MVRLRLVLTVAACAVLCGLLVGCIGNEDGSPGNQTAQPEPASVDDERRPAVEIELTARNRSGIGAVTWNGSQLEAGEGSDCSSPSCESVPFTLTPTQADEVSGELVVSASWDPYRFEDRGADSPGRLNVSVETPDGTLVTSSSLLWGSAAVVTEPAPGAYVAQVRAKAGATAYRGAIQLDDRTSQLESANASSPEPLLPDLVTMPVLHLNQQRPYTKYGLRPGGTGAVDEATGLRGCSPYETTQRDARNCLRLTNAIGNVGQGPLEVRLTFENATRALAPVLESRFTQAIYRTDGSVRLAESAPAEYHVAHEHYHKEGLASFTLYEYDEETSERGEAVTEGRKTSWCLVDMGVVDPGGDHPIQAPQYPLDGSRQPGQGNTNCEAAVPGEPMVTGVSAGWWDMYEWYAPDQYVEITDLPDGTYELVSVANPENEIVEANASNNAGGVVFSWQDGEIDVLDRWTQAYDH